MVHPILFVFWRRRSQERTKALELKYKLAMEDTWIRFVDGFGIVCESGGLKKCNEKW